jgi:hypothetical protein
MFSPSGRSVVSFTVTGAEYRLKSGIGVGSAWTEVIEAFGIGSFASSNGEIIYTYRVVDSNGDLVPAFLNLVVENEVVVRFGVVTSW